MTTMATMMIHNNCIEKSRFQGSNFWINFYCCTGIASCAKKAEIEHEKEACSAASKNRKAAEPWNFGTYFLLCDSSKKEVRDGFIY